MLDIEFYQKVQKHLLYNDDGTLTWIDPISPRIKKGSIAGYVSTSDGYVYIKAFGKRFSAHRLIWVMHYNELPGEIDHINRVRHDNRIENLRSATHHDNMGNRSKTSNCSSIYQGVSWDNWKKKWVARICNGWKQQSLGSFDSEVEAALAYNEAAKQIFGEFANLNKIED